MDGNTKAKHYGLIFSILVLMASVFLILFELNGNRDYREGLAYSFMSVMVFAIFVFALMRNENKVFSHRISIMYVGLIVSGVLLLLSVFFDVYHLWFAGFMLISAIYGITIGFSGMAMYMCIYGICYDTSVEEIVFYLLLGIILCYLISFFPFGQKEVKYVNIYFYMLVIAVCSHVTLYMITNHLDISLLLQVKFLLMLLYTVLLVSVIYFSLYIINNQSAKEDITENDYAAIIKPAFPLLKRLKDEKESVYKHSLLIGKISSKAAALIGADDMLAAAGGIYHDIGKLIDNNEYIEHGVRLANEYEFDDRLINIIESHSLKNAMPKSKEAVIVYFADYILSTINYMRYVRKDNSVSNESIVESIFADALRNGKIDEAGLSITEYNKLKKYYIDYFNEMG